MRLKGTKYEKIEKLPDGAVTCREYAEKNELGSGAYVQVKYDRFLNGKGKYPGYDIRCWNGINVVIQN